MLLLHGESVTESSAPPVTVSVVIPCLNEAESIGAVRDARRSAFSTSTASTARCSSSTTAPTTAAVFSPASPAPGRRRAPARLRQRLSRRLRGGARRLHRDDRRRPHLRLRGDPALRPRARRRRRARDGKPDGRRPARARCPALSRIGNPLLSGFLNLLFRTPVGDAHCGMRAVRRDVLPARSAGDRDGVRLRDGDPRGARRPRDSRAADRAAPAGGRIEALAVPRRLAAPAPDARLHPSFLFLMPGARGSWLGARARWRSSSRTPPLFGHDFCSTR